MTIPQDGRYKCKLAGQIVIYEAQTGSLCAALPCQMEDGFTFKHTCVIVKSDQTVMTKTVDTLKQVFGWDGLDPFWLMDTDLSAVEFEIVGGPETNDKGTTYFKSQWLNPVGGGMNTPEAANRQSVMAKYGSKFRALAGTTAAPKPPMPAAPKPPVPTAPSLPTATMEEAWAALNEANPGKEQKVLEGIWFDTIGRMFPNTDAGSLKPHQWGKLKAELADYVPM